MTDSNKEQSNLQEPERIEPSPGQLNLPLEETAPPGDLSSDEIRKRFMIGYAENTQSRKSTTTALDSGEITYEKGVELYTAENQTRDALDRLFDVAKSKNPLEPGETFDEAINEAIAKVLTTGNEKGAATLRVLVDMILKELKETKQQVLEQDKELRRKEAEAQGAASEGLHKITIVKPGKAVYPISKVASKVTELSREHEGEEVDVLVSRKGAKKEVNVITLIQYEDKNLFTNKGTLDKVLTEYDKSLMNAACSLYEAGNKEITPEALYHTMHGILNSSKISKLAIAKVNASMNKLISTRLTIDMTEQVEKWKWDIKNPILRDYLISAMEVSGTINGQKITSYKLHTEPILLSYSKRSNQVLRVPIALLDTRKTGLRNSDDIAVIRDYLILRVMGEYYKNPVISYETIIEKCEIDMDVKNQPKKRMNLRDDVKKILENFLSEGAIKGYKEIKAGKVLTGVKILY